MTLSESLHRTPWWALLAGSFGVFVVLCLVAVPLRVIQLAKSGTSAAETRAIKHEIGAAFSEEAIDLSAGVLREMRSRTRDPSRREELDRALAEINQARESVRQAGREVQRATAEAKAETEVARRDAEQALEDTKRDARATIEDAKRQARDAVEAARVGASAAPASAAPAPAAPRSAAPPPAEPSPLPAAPPAPSAAQAPGKVTTRHIVVNRGVGPSVSIDLDDDEDDDKEVKPDPALPPLVLPVQQRQQIHARVVDDIRRMGVGAGLILIFIPLFLLTIISKFFIDRSRAAQRMAEVKRREADYHRMSRQVTEAKLSALQAQVEPHFLYNTLANVQALTEVDPARANAMTGHLIQYLRNALPKMRDSVSTVGQEVELVRAYLNILQMRMGERLAFEIDVPPELSALPFPPLMLPSLVENSIKHGLESQREGGRVRIAASESGGVLRVTVEDTGRGFSDTPGAGVGLTNIRERLAALYGDAGRLTLEASLPHGVLAAIEVPRDGAHPPGVEAPARPLEPSSATARTIAAMGTAERVWRRSLSFAFVVLVCVAAVAAGLAIVSIATGALPIQLGNLPVVGTTGALLGTATVAFVFALVVLALAIVLVVVYGLGFLAAGLAIFIPLVVLVALFPVLAPLILLALGVWWFLRWRNRSVAAASVAPGSTVPPPPAEPMPAPTADRAP